MNGPGLKARYSPCSVQEEMSIWGAPCIPPKDAVAWKDQHWVGWGGSGLGREEVGPIWGGVRWDPDGRVVGGIWLYKGERMWERRTELRGHVSQTVGSCWWGFPLFLPKSKNTGNRQRDLWSMASCWVMSLGKGGFQNICGGEGGKEG